MKRPKKRMFLLAAVVALYGALVVSDHGVLIWLTNTTPSHPPDKSTDSHGVLSTFRCHYFTGTGMFDFETSMGFGAEPCGLIKRQNWTNEVFAQSSLA